MRNSPFSPQILCLECGCIQNKGIQAGFGDRNKSCGQSQTCFLGELVVVWGCSQYVEWQDGNSRKVLKQVSLGAVPVLWAQPGDWENWESGMLQECGVRVWNRYCTAGRAGEGLQGFREDQLKQHRSFGWSCAGAGAGILVGPFQGRAFHDCVKTGMWQK